MKEFNFWCKENTDFGKCDNKKCGFFYHYLKKTRYRVHRIRESQELVFLYNVYYKDIIFHDVSHEKALFLLDHLSGARMSLSRTIVKKSNKKGYYYE